MSKIKLKSRIYKIVGGGLLLLSFIVQNFIYDYWNEKSEEYINVNRDFSDMNRSSLLYLNLYFNAKIENDTLEKEIKKQYIFMAAEKQALGKISEITTRDMNKQDKVNLCNSIIQKSKTVYNYNSYLDFLEYINKVDSYRLENIIDRVQTIKNSRENYRWFFLIAYIVGSFILLIGIKFE